METITAQTARANSIAYQVEKLEPRIRRLDRLSNLWSWIRAGAFIGGFVGGVIIGNLATAQVGLAVFLFGMMVFAGAILVHRRFEYWHQTFAFWRDWRADQLARIGLAWDKLPPARAAPIPALALDLDLVGPRSLHHLLDTTSALPSSRLLADWLSARSPDRTAITARQSIVRELVPLHRFRDRFRLAFRLVLEEQVEGEDLLHWLKVEMPTRRLGLVLIAAAGLVVINATLFALYQWAALPPLWVGSLLAYIAFYFLSQPMIAKTFQILTRLEAELDRFAAVLKFLETYTIHNSPHLEELCAPLRNSASSPSRQTRLLKAVAAGVGLRSNPILGIILNVILPWDFAVAFLAAIVRERLVDSFPQWLEICYRLDALVALANYAHLNPDNAFPQFDANGEPPLLATRLGHPLIPEPNRVRNDFTVDRLGQVDIITGSNMAGKSTFLKTIGINFCLGYAGAPVCATCFRSGLFRLHTCIRITDSIVDGFSYFYAEVKCLKRLLEGIDANDPLPLLYLIDEIFRGTNNRERLIGSRAYVQSLIGRRSIGLIATHDLELASLASDSPLVRNLHFRDRVEKDRLTFDYLLRVGPSPTTNAIKIMRMEGLPIPEDNG